MIDTPIIAEQVYEAPIAKVWQALTDERKMSVWYFPQLKKFSPVVGYKFVFTDDESDYQKEWVVTQVEDSRLLAHSWVYKGYPGGSEVIFELIKEGDNTRLKLKHTGLASFPIDPHFARQRFADGWERIIRSNLKNYLERNV